MVNDKPSQRKRARDAARARILAAARQVFAANGLAGARLEAIAREADCTKGLVVHYYGGKQGLWDAVMDYYLGMGASSGFLNDPGSPDAGSLLQFMQRSYRFFQTHPDFNALANRAASDSDISVPEDFFKLLRQAEQAFRKAGDSGLLNPHLDPRHLQLFSFLLISGWFTYRDVFTHAWESRPASPADDQAVFQAAMELFHNGALSKQAPKPNDDTSKRNS